MATIPDEVRDAVIEKWLTYCKAENLNEFLMWRIHIMSRNISSIEQNVMKIILREKRAKDEKSVTHRDKKGNFSTKYSSYGTLIQKCYPLLDPDISNEKRLKKHQRWFHHSSSWGQYLIQDHSLLENDAFTSLTVEELSEKAPACLWFMPTKKVFAKLIKRATQIKDPIKEINAYE